MQKIEIQESESKTEEKSSWIKTKPTEVEKLVIQLAKEGNSPAKIGLILRDNHSVPKAKLISKKITKILKTAKVNYKTEKEGVSEKIENLKKHLEKNKYDQSAKRSLTKKLWFLYSLNKKN